MFNCCDNSPHITYIIYFIMYIFLLYIYYKCILVQQEQSLHNAYGILERDNISSRDSHHFGISSRIITEEKSTFTTIKSHDAAREHT